MRKPKRDCRGFKKRPWKKMAKDCWGFPRSAIKQDIKIINPIKKYIAIDTLCIAFHPNKIYSLLKKDNQKLRHIEKR